MFQLCHNGTKKQKRQGKQKLRVGRNNILHPQKSNY